LRQILLAIKPTELTGNKPKDSVSSSHLSHHVATAYRWGLHVPPDVSCTKTNKNLVSCARLNMHVINLGNFGNNTHCLLMPRRKNTISHKKLFTSSQSVSPVQNKSQHERNRNRTYALYMAKNARFSKERHKIVNQRVKTLFCNPVSITQRGTNTYTLMRQTL
jgi:hypothetical protein